MRKKVVRGRLLSMVKSVMGRSSPLGHTTSREKPHGVDPELSPDLERAPDRMVMTEGVPVNLTLQLTRGKIDQ